MQSPDATQVSVSNPGAKLNPMPIVPSNLACHRLELEGILTKLIGIVVELNLRVDKKKNFNVMTLVRPMSVPMRVKCLISHLLSKEEERFKCNVDTL